ncbi:hypothetical protein D9M69_483910 [compost metagenome]
MGGTASQGGQVFQEGLDVATGRLPARVQGETYGMGGDVVVALDARRLVILGGPLGKAAAAFFAIIARIAAAACTG